MATKQFVEPRHTGEHVLSEANGARSRDKGVLAAGNLPAGAVLCLDANADFIAADGSALASAVLYGAADATDAPQPVTVHSRACEVSAADLVWPEGADEAAIEKGISDLAQAGIIVRS